MYSVPIVIIDYGSQYTQLIARRVREQGVYCEILAPELEFQQLTALQPKGIILSGGPSSVINHQDDPLINTLFDSNYPVLGICYGMQLMAHKLGGKVSYGHQAEFGHAELSINQPSLLFEGIELDKELSVWMSHGDHVTQLPPQFKTIAGTASIPIAAMAQDDKSWFGLQFHPEVTHTQQGEIILQRFVQQVCDCETTWQPDCVIEQSVTKIQKQVGNDKVLLALSGGVDSSVLAALLHKAIGDQLTCVFVDTGLLRQDEVSQVQQTFAEHLGINLISVDAKKQFFHALAGQDDPEKKRKIIGNTFITVFEQQAEQLSNHHWLAQGTIYPDFIESGGISGSKAAVIKSHHNVGGLPEALNFKLLEPLKYLFKDEVRRVGRTLGLPEQIISRHPFPGPGLGVRILGEIKPNYVEILRQADAIFMQVLQQQNWYHKVNQAFAVFLPVKSVGVKGDARRYDYVIALRAVTTTDFMTAKWAELPYSLLAEAANRIMNEVPHVSRVTYDISGKPPATIEWE